MHHYNTNTFTSTHRNLYNSHYCNRIQKKQILSSIISKAYRDKTLIGLPILRNRPDIFNDSLLVFFDPSYINFNWNRNISSTLLTTDSIYIYIYVFHAEDMILFLD